MLRETSPHGSAPAAALVSTSAIAVPGFFSGDFRLVSTARRIVVQRPVAFNAFEFAVLAGLRAAQLARGCTARVAGDHKFTVTAQMEVAQRKIVRAQPPDGPR